MHIQFNQNYKLKNDLPIQFSFLRKVFKKSPFIFFRVRLVLNIDFFVRVNSPNCFHTAPHVGTYPGDHALSRTLKRSGLAGEGPGISLQRSYQPTRPFSRSSLACRKGRGIQASGYTDERT